MRAAAERVSLPAALLTAALVAALLLRPEKALAFELWAFVLASLLVVVLTRETLAAYSARAELRGEAPARSARRALRPAELVALERAVALGCSETYALEDTLRPVLRGIAAERLLVRRSIVLDAEPDEARRALGDRVWAIVAEQTSPGPPIAPADLRAAVDALERL
jgi:hypothetical protein